MKYFANFLKKMITKRNVAYLFINIGNIPIMTIVSSFLAVYYVDVLRMNEYAVGTMFLIARIFDGINDPIIGEIIDRIPGNKFRKFNRILITGTIICSMNYIILWLGPALVENSWKMVVAYVSYLLLGVTFPIMDISLNSLLPVLTKEQEEREILSSIKVIGYGIGTVMIEIIIPIILTKFGTSVKVYNAIIVIFILVVLIFTVGGVLGLRNNRYFENEYGNLKKTSGISSFIMIFTERNVFYTFLSGVFFYTANAMLAVSNTYFAMYYLGSVKYLVYVTFATYSLEMFVVLLISEFTKKWGTRNVFAIGLIISGIGLVIRFIPWNNISIAFIVLLLSCAMYGFGYGLVMILFYSIQAENVDMVYRKKRIESEGTIAALMSMVNKFGKGIGGAIPLYILGIMKLPNGTYSQLSLRLIDGLIPALLFVIAGIIFGTKYKIENNDAN